MRAMEYTPDPLFVLDGDYTRKRLRDLECVAEYWRACAAAAADSCDHMASELHYGVPEGWEINGRIKYAHQWAPDREARWLDVAERFARYPHADEADQ